MTNGYPVTAVIDKKSIVVQGSFISSKFLTERIALAVIVKTVECYENIM